MVKRARWLAVVSLIYAASAVPAPAVGAGHGDEPSAGKVERLTCKLGTEDRHARIAVELIDGRVQRFAYYSKWKPRTCSVYVVRDGALSSWKDAGPYTAVMTEKGSFLIENRAHDVYFLFRDVDRRFYCGMEGTISGSLVVTRGNEKCELTGIMDEKLDDDAGTTMVSAPAAAPVQVRMPPARDASYTATASALTKQSAPPVAMSLPPGSHDAPMPMLSAPSSAAPLPSASLSSSPYSDPFAPQD